MLGTASAAALRAVFLCLGLGACAGAGGDADAQAPAVAESAAPPGAPAPVARPACDARGRVLGHLARKYREAAVAMGVTNRGGLVEVLTTDDGATWTIIVTTPQGVSCLVLFGEGWRAIPRWPGDPEA